MAKIFVSYRRNDTRAITDRITAALKEEFGETGVFQDVENIPPGVNFKTYLQEAVAVCDILLVIIGQQWVTTSDDRGERRLNNPADFVRIEVETGLQRDDVLVIPVLVDNAQMPREADLPESLRPLHFLNAIPVGYNPQFDTDIKVLIRRIHDYLKDPTAYRQAMRNARPARWRQGLLGMGAILLIALAAFVGTKLMGEIGDDQDGQTSSQTENTPTLTVTSDATSDVTEAIASTVPTTIPTSVTPPATTPVTAVAATSPLYPCKAVVSAPDGSNIRSGPAIGYSIITSVTYGESFSVLSKANDNFVEVDYQGQSQYLALLALSLEGDCKDFGLTADARIPHAIACEGVGFSYLTTGGQAKVIAPEGLTLHIEADPDTPPPLGLDRLPVGAIVSVMNGPDCTVEDGGIWWQVTYLGATGYVPEFANATLNLEPFPLSRAIPPTGYTLLHGGLGLTDGTSQSDGSMQIEGLCLRDGYTSQNNGFDSWWCANSSGEPAYYMTPLVLDEICRLTYSNSEAIAIRNGLGSAPIYRWRCYSPG